MNLDINKIIAAHILNNQGITTLEIANGLFPELSDTQAIQTLSRIRNGHRQRVLDSSFIIRMCKLFNISPNEAFNYDT